MLNHPDAMWRYAEYQAEIARAEGRRLPVGVPLMSALSTPRWSMRRRQHKRKQ